MAKAKTATKKPAAAKEAFKIVKKRSGRFAVVDSKTQKYVNGDEKVKVLLGKGLIKTKLKAAAPAEAETPAT